VVLGVEDDHGGAVGQAAGQQVGGVGGVAGEDDGVVGPGAGEGSYGVAGLLVAGGGELGGVPRAAVHAGVGRERGGDGRADRLQTGGAGGVVEVGVADQLAALDGHLKVGAEHGGDGPALGDGGDGGLVLLLGNAGEDRQRGHGETPRVIGPLETTEPALARHTS